MGAYKRKAGENEALQILKSKGITFNEFHFDDGKTGYSMPDLQYSNGRYLEVTHTLHNNELTNPQSRMFFKRTTQEQCDITEKASNAYKRMRNRNYPTESGKMDGLTKEGLEQFARDKKLINHFFGELDEQTGKRSEFKCDMPMIDFSSDNILRVIQEKGKKHSSGNTDLFIFVTKDEYESMMHLINTRKFNSCYLSFIDVILNSPFITVYVCIWLFEEQCYVVDNPTIMKFWKNENKLNYHEI